MDILYVEDNPDHIFLFKKALKRIERQADCMYLDNGQDALDYFFSRGSYANAEVSIPKVLVLDMNLHGISGLEILQTIRTSHGFKHIPVIIFSTSDDTKSITQAYEMGVNAYLVKPSGFDDLTTSVRNMTAFWLDSNKRVN